MNKLDKLYHKKQQEVLKYALKHDFFMLINHGAKRTGKTVLNNDLFLMELRRVKKIAESEGVTDPQYILAGADLGALQRNVLIELTNKYNLEFHFDKHNRFKLFGVLVCCFGHSKINDLKRIRGMTSYGAYINEGSTANIEVFNEIKSRCSGNGARILIDTNPEHPEHWLKKEYIDKADFKTIAEFSYKLDDNTFLSDRYRNNIKSSTPSGMFFDRDILGLWVSAEGVVYKDFDSNKHYIDTVDINKLVHFYAGVDWGYEHYGSIVVIGMDKEGKHYILKEYSTKHQEIDYWVDIANEIKIKYGNIIFYCDTARPEHIVRFKREGIKAMMASKRILAGIETVSKLFKTDKLFIVKDGVSRFKQEIYSYIWDDKKGLPVKEFDDVMDSIRYAIYSDAIVNRRG